MGISRRIQNVMLDSPYAAAKCLRTVDLMRHLFCNTSASAPPPSVTIEQGSGAESAADCSNPKNKQAQSSKIKMDRIRLPSPIFTFESTRSMEFNRDVYCFPFVDGKTLWTDHRGFSFLCDPEDRILDIMPRLHKPKYTPISIFVPNADADDDYDNYVRGSSLFVMERFPELETEWSTPWSDQFEALVYCKSRPTPLDKSWMWQLVPPPPYIREQKHWSGCHVPEISSYASLGSRICISVEGVGTYCLDTASHQWGKLASWNLPFRGMVEYVPELKLWFGLTAEDGSLAAADLSAMDMGSPPQLLTVTAPWNWKEELCLPEEWKESNGSQLVNLGSGRFCITSFFRTPEETNVVVFRGVETTVQDANGGGGNRNMVQLQMISHKSMYLQSKDVAIDVVL